MTMRDYGYSRQPIERRARLTAAEMTTRVTVRTAMTETNCISVKLKMLQLCQGMEMKEHTAQGGVKLGE